MSESAKNNHLSINGSYNRAASYLNHHWSLPSSDGSVCLMQLLVSYARTKSKSSKLGSAVMQKQQQE